MRFRTLAWAGALLGMLAGVAVAQTLQTSPQTPGNSIPPGSAAAIPGSRPAAPPAAYRAGTTTININTASAAELDTLPGIGKARAAKIIRNRPYRSVADLQAKHVIPRNVYNQIKDRVTVGPA